MPDPTIDPVITPASEPAEPITEPVVDPTVTPEPQVDPLKLSVEAQSRYKSAADLEAFAAQRQGEADRLRSEFETYKQQHPELNQPQPPHPTSEERIEKFAGDPDAFVREVAMAATNDIRAQVALSEFARTHPDMETYKDGMKGIVERNPGVLADPQGLEMVYLLARNQGDATKLTEAAAIKNAHNAQVLTNKQTGAIVEGATPPQPTSSPKVTLGMSPEESEKALQAQGIPDATDEDRIS